MDVYTIAEYLVLLEAPEHVVRTMDQTRALDGMREATWNNILATWTYHPDAGLDIILSYENN